MFDFREMSESHVPSHALRALAALLLCALVPACGDDPPNLVLVTVDTLRADHMSLYGYERRTTPAIERWAEEGTVFERCWSPCSWTVPAMAMLLTGVLRVGNEQTIAPDETTLAELLRWRGYATGAVVANALLNEEKQFHRGFEHYDLVPRPRGAGRRTEWVSFQVVDRGIEWLEERGEQPFFLFLHLFDPHDRYEPLGGLAFEPYEDPGREAAFRAALPEGERQLLTTEAYREIERRIALYDSEILQADAGLARLFEYLERAGLADETVVVLTSDHGEGLWQRANTKGEAFKDNAYFPQLYFDHGVQPYSEQVHVPLVLRGPGVPAGARRTEDVTLLDVVPTLAALLDLPAPAGADFGTNVLSPDMPAHRDVLSVCSRGTSLTVDGRWRLHEPREYRVERFGAVPELYDLTLDPLELDPLVEPDRIARMRERIEAIRSAHAEPAGATEERSDAEAALLRDLGYAGEADEVPGAAHGAGPAARGHTDDEPREP